jgi:hypothetical protein
MVIRVLAAVPLTSALLLAGCGGGSGSSYDAGTTASCWSLKNADITQLTDDPDDVDSFFSDAPSAYHVTLNENEVDVAFYRTSGDAKRDIAGYKLLGAAFLGEDANLDEIVYTKGNTGLSWDNTPTSAEKDAIEGCFE